MKNVLVAVFLAWLALPASRADTWLRADAYFIPWEVETRAALTPERVRQLANFKHTFTDNAPAVAQLLELTKLKPAKNGQPEDARLVIDLIDDTGQRHTFYASQFNFYSADSKQKRAIDEPFRQRLTRLAKQYKAK